MQIENIIYKELKKNNLKVLFLQYKNNIINIFVYNYFNPINSLKFQIIKYFSYNSKMQKIVERFGISKNLINWFLKLKKVDLQDYPKTHLNLKKFSLVYLIYSKYVILLLIFAIKKCKIDIKQIHKIFWIFYGLTKLFWISSYEFFYLKNPIKIKKKKLKKINGLVKFKIMNVLLENIIFKLLNKFVQINIQNIFLNRGLFLKYQLQNKYFKANNFFLIQTILLSFLYRNSSILIDFFVLKIQENHNHKKILKDFVNIINSFYYSNFMEIKGFQLKLSGKINGNMRKSIYYFKLGKLKLQTLIAKIIYGLGFSYTKFGVISIKLWLLNGDN